MSQTASLSAADGTKSRAPSSGDLKSIQWLRAFAALAVVFFHLAERLPSHGIVSGISLGLPGAAGVDVFFVISGFIMHSITAGRPLAPAAFLRARAIRIIPLYWLITTALVAGALLRPSWFGKLQLHVDHVLSSYLFIPWRSPVDGLITPVLSQGWTLNYEMFFYLLFALCLLAPAARRLQVLSGVLIGLFLSGLVLQPTSVIAQAYTSQLLLEFLIGAWLAQVWQRGRLSMSTRSAVVLAALSITALLATAPLGTETIDRYRALLWGIPALLIVAAALSREADIRAWPMVGARIGDTSYSLYLVHGIVISLAAKCVGLTASSGVVSQIIFALLAIFGSLAAGWLCWRLVERPLARAFAQPRTIKTGMRTPAEASPRPAQ